MGRFAVPQLIMEADIVSEWNEFLVFEVRRN